MQTWYTPPLAGIHGLGADASAANQTTNPSSPWANLFTSFGTAAINIGGAYASRELGISLPAGGTPPATQQPTTASAVGPSNWILPAVIVGGALLFFVFNQRGGRRR